MRELLRFVLGLGIALGILSVGVSWVWVLAACIKDRFWPGILIFGGVTLLVVCGLVGDWLKVFN